MPVAPAGDFLMDKITPALLISSVEILLVDREVLRLRCPKVKHRCDNVKGVSDAKNGLLGSERFFHAKRIVRLYEPRPLIYHALAAEA